MGAGFRKLVVASGLSNLADGVFQVALPLVTLGVTRDPTAFAAVTVALRLPWLLCALPAGALADRLDRRRTMFLVNLGRAVLIGGLALALATGSETLWLLCAVAFTLGVGETLFDTAAQSIVPTLVGDPDRLSRANGRLYAVELVMNQFIGPPLGGLLVGLTAAGALTGSAATYLLAAMALALIGGSFRPSRTGPPTRLHHDVVEGARYLFSHRLLRTLALLTGTANLTGTAALTLLPLYAVDGPMGLSEAGFGLLLTAGAVGAFVGSFLAAPVERALGRARTLLVAFLAFSVSTVMPGLTASVVAVAAASLLGGTCSVIWNVITVSLRQRIAPDHLLGRVNAGDRLLAWGSMPLGALLGGVLADLFGLRAGFLIAAATALAALPLLLSVVTESAIHAAEQQPGAPSEPALT